MKNWEAVWLVLKTAGPMSVGNILLTVEWELLAIFAAHLGAAPVAAWGIVGTIWGILEYVTECVSEAGEIRVAKLLGNGNPRLAKLSAYKCLFVGNTIATLVTVVFLIGMPWVPGLFTDNQNLQGLIADVLPYCAIGNFALTVGSLSWTLIGAQGRYAVATFHGCIGSIGVTIPAACFTTFYLGWGLPALAATVVIGYMTSSAFNVITLFLSDWEYIAYRVMMRNGATEPVAEDDYFGDVGQWNVFNFMSKNLEIPFMDENDSHRSKGSKTGSNTEDESQSHRSTNKDNGKS
jgi:Na+-driven multidrug efflux pump